MGKAMKKNGLEAISDGVLAVLITIMVLELKAPHDVSAQALVRMMRDPLWDGAFDGSRGLFLAHQHHHCHPWQ